ncbi:hypothetical protein [Actinoplanes friuliensis]|uniref:hypothetical protein n=1 Tax=Actinoplanes friuliensis TaxID=196914 RepID=UPI00130E1624|nr:hypothetical protein [Actinoplanes friuliensis]
MLGEPVQAVADQLSVLVVAERADPGSGVLQVFAGVLEVADLSVAVREVEVQGRIQAGDRQRHAGLRVPLVGEHVGCGQSPLIPQQFLVHVVLDVGDRVSEDADVQGVALLAADLGPDQAELPRF